MVEFDPRFLGILKKDIADLLEVLNKRIRAHAGRNADGFQLGHSYFLRGEQPIRDFASLAEALQDDSILLLEEYCGGDFAALEQILGAALVDLDGQWIRHDLFEKAYSGALIEDLRQLAGSAAADRATKTERAGLAKTK